MGRHPAHALFPARLELTREEIAGASPGTNTNDATRVRQCREMLLERIPIDVELLRQRANRCRSGKGEDMKYPIRDRFVVSYYRVQRIEAIFEPGDLAAKDPKKI